MARTVAIGLQDFGDLYRRIIFMLTKLLSLKKGGRVETV